MSKLLEKLRKIGQTEPQRIGFGAPVRGEKRAAMALVAELPKASTELAQRAIKSGADAIFVAAWERPDELQPFKSVGGETPWGARLPEHYEGTADPLIAAGCDYVAFVPAATRLAVLGWEKIGKVLELSPEVPDARLRAIEMLPVDLVLLDDPGTGPFTIADLLDLARLMAFARKPAVLRARADLWTEDLAPLRDSGIAGVMVPVGEAGWEESLRRFRAAIDTLPPRAKRQRTTMDAILPQVRTPETRPEPEEE